jgi:hypothetical protein
VLNLSDAHPKGRRTAKQEQIRCFSPRTIGPSLGGGKLCAKLKKRPVLCVVPPLSTQ